MTVFKLILWTLLKMFMSMVSQRFLSSAISSFISSRFDPFFSAAGRTALGETAGALDKVKVVVIPPGLDVRLADHVHRADQLHALKILAVELRHHRLDFPLYSMPMSVVSITSSK